MATDVIFFMTFLESLHDVHCIMSLDKQGCKLQIEWLLEVKKREFNIIPLKYSWHNNLIYSNYIVHDMYFLVI